MEKNTYHTISIYKNCMTSIFLMATAKTFPSNIEIALNIFCFFFNCKSNFVFKQTFSKKSLLENFIFFCLQNLVLDTQRWIFFCFSGELFSNRLKTLIVLYFFSMPYNLKVSFLKTIIFENFCKNLKI